MPLSTSDNIAAVIVTHKRVELLRASLEVVAAQTHPVKWIIVVDNGCEDAVRDLLHSVAGDRGIYLPSHTNLGGAGGFAYGFLTALALGADAIWCADDDGRPEGPQVLATLIDAAVTHQLDEVSPVVCNMDDPNRLAFPYAADSNGDATAANSSTPTTPATPSYPASHPSSTAHSSPPPPWNASVFLTCDYSSAATKSNTTAASYAPDSTLAPA